MTLNWFIFDGVPKWLLESLVASGELPFFKEIIDKGCFFETKPSYPNCQTPAAMATLLTGQSQNEHEINGFWMQGKTNHKEYLNSLLDARPKGKLVWEEFEEGNFDIDLVQVPWFKKSAVNFHFFGGINNLITKGKYFDLTNQIALEINDKSGVVNVTKQDSSTYLLKSGTHYSQVDFNNWIPFTSSEGYSAWYRLVKSNQKIYLVRTGAWQTEYSSERGNYESLDNAFYNSPFIGDTLGDMYRNGIFGEQFYRGGNGVAEEVYLDLFKIAFDYYKIVLNELLKHSENQKKLRIIYVPFTDDIGHELIGFVNSDINVEKMYRKKALEIICKVYNYADQLLEIVCKRDGDSDIVISSDHGMNGVSTMFHPNDVLLAAGYASHSRGDFENTNEECSQVIYHVVNNGFIYDNTQSKDNTIFTNALEKITNFVDPISGKKVIKEIVDLDGSKVELSNFKGNKCYLVFSEYVMPSPEVTASLSVLSMPNRSATHHMYNSNKLNGIFITSFKLENKKKITSNSQVKSIIIKKVRE